MAEEAVPLEFIARKLDDIQAEQRAIRKDIRDVTKVALSTLDHGRRVERNLAELRRHLDEIRDDIELVVKSEIMGRFADVETRLDARLDQAINEIRAQDFGPTRHG